MTHVDAVKDKSINKERKNQTQSVVSLNDVQKLYNQKAGAPYFWYENGQLNTCGLELIKFLQFMLPQPEFQKIIQKVQHASVPSNPLQADSIIKTDMVLTQSFASYLYRLYYGALKPSSLHETLDAIHPAWALVYFQKLISSDPTCRFLATHFEEKDFHPQYQKLKVAHAQYKEFIDYDWPTLKKTLVPGQQGDDVVKLRKILYMHGDLLPDLNKSRVLSSHYDSDVMEGVKRFQQRHDLPVTGMLDKQTLKMINLTPKERLKVIEINLERYRWLHKNLGKNNTPYILINIPSHTLYGYVGDKITYQMNIAVGKDETPTPLLHTKMISVIENPFWALPDDMARKNVIPQVKKNPNFLKNKNMIAVDENENIVNKISVKDLNKLQYIYKSGASNPLGQYLFHLDNEYKIHLHDTTAKHVFKEQDKKVSSGCVRLSDAKGLYQWLTQFVKLKQDKVYPKTYGDPQARLLNLVTPLPVYVTYFTIWVDDDGFIHFYKDTYHHDKTMLKKHFN